MGNIFQPISIRSVQIPPSMVYMRQKYNLRQNYNFLCFAAKKHI